ncbi:MAG TPA: glycosyltransferase family 2 protein [Pyrinomonadaceae bacterium]|jgi:glycosyltransferase involved in cell wall biosynthesis
MQEIKTLEKNVVKRVGRDVVRHAPKVSIIIPAYNIAEYVAETLNSVFAQTYSDYEVVVINDGSPDTEEFERVLEPFRDKIVYLAKEGAGAGEARNVGIENARGYLIAFLDGDDVWLPEYLESQIKFLEDNDFDFVYADALHFGGSAYDGTTFMETSPSVGEANFDSLLDLRCNVITSGTIVRKQNLIEAGMFERERVRAHDFVLWLKMARSGARIGYQRKVLLKYRVRIESLSGDSIDRVKREIDVYKRVVKTFELDEKQKNIVENHLQRLESDLEVERGKSFLLREEFDAAKNSFTKANEYRRSRRLGLIIKLLQFAPRLILKFYRSRRAAEIAFVPNNEKTR